MTLPGSARWTELFWPLYNETHFSSFVFSTESDIFADFLFTHPPGQIGFYRFTLDLLGAVGMVSRPMA